MTDPTSKLAERISKYMACLDPAVSGAHGHNTTFHAACVLVHGFGLSVEQSWPFALEYNGRCDPPWSDRDLHRKLEQANLKPGDRPRGYLLGTGDSGSVPCSTWTPGPPKPKKVFQPEILEAVASRGICESVTAEYLEARSKFTTWNRSPAGFLHKLYRPGEKVVVFNVFESQGCAIWEHPGIAGNLSTLDYLQADQQSGVWYMAQPVDGQYHWNPRQEKESRRSEEAVTSWRYLVIESDAAPKDVWLKALVRLPLPIAAVYDSGGDSIHVLVLVNAESKAQWDEIVRCTLRAALVTLGACDGSLTGVRLTRLPNCRREKKGQLQRLLYLDDSPDGVPICEKPLREAPEVARLRWGGNVVETTWFKEFSGNLPVAERSATLEAVDGV